MVRIPEKVETRDPSASHTSLSMGSLYHFQHITQCNFSSRSHQKESILENGRPSLKFCKQSLTLVKGYPPSPAFPICLPSNRKDTKKQVFGKLDSQILA